MSFGSSEHPITLEFLNKIVWYLNGQTCSILEWSVIQVKGCLINGLTNELLPGIQIENKEQFDNQMFPLLKGTLFRSLLYFVF